MDTGQMRVAVLGTGIMGSAMARNLIAAGLARPHHPCNNDQVTLGVS